MTTPAEVYRLKHVEHLTWRQIMERTGLSHDAARDRYRRYARRLEREAEGQPLSKPPVIVAPPAQEGVTDVGSGNAREIETASTRITTLEQLLDACRVDLDVWAVERYVINKWEVGAKGPTGEIVIEPLFQVKAWLARKFPEAIQPVIQPVTIAALPRTTPQPESGGLKIALIVPDLQVGFSREVMHGKLTPFHDRRAVDAVLQIAAEIQPDETHVIGDGLDFSGWSDKFIARPEFTFTTQPALIEMAWLLNHLRAHTTGRMTYIEGNHELRPEKQLITHLIAAYGLRSADNLIAPAILSVDNLLGLTRMGVEYIGNYPDGEVWLNDTTRIVHGDKVRSQPGQTSAALVRDSNETVIYGHIHRKEMATKTIAFRGGSRTVTAYCPGCLCHVDGRVPGSKRTDQWQQGAAVVYFDAHVASIVPIDINDGRAMYQGKIYTGRDYVDDLRRDTCWEF